MGMPQMLQKLAPKINKENGFLILVLVGLVVAAEFVEKDFMCPCEQVLRWAFFFFYLLIPAFVTSTVTYCIMCELYKEDSEEKSDVESEGQTTTEKRPRQPSSRTEETKDGCCNAAEGPKNWKFIIKCLFPTVVWLILFFIDGRFVACLATEYKEGHADSDPHPPWEWCHKSRNLTDAQQHAEKSHRVSKVVGFVLLSFISVVILIIKCVIECKASRQQKKQQAEDMPLQARARAGQS